MVASSRCDLTQQRFDRCGNVLRDVESIPQYVLTYFGLNGSSVRTFGLMLTVR
jgi:hypothetical protein